MTQIKSRRNRGVQPRRPLGVHKAEFIWMMTGLSILVATLLWAYVRVVWL